MARLLIGKSILDLDVGEEENDVIRNVSNESDGAPLVQTAGSELSDGLDRGQRGVC